uniref:Uncharacterized protein n=1 Tax=Siphoviridae sp. ctOba29 TaxID=2825480 RepID=A0A8S5NXK3_9CAUD|nr:MAG TPA: hypothetical protein [Siphoviridae sp. ctOba29]
MALCVFLHFIVQRLQEPVCTKNAGYWLYPYFQ